MKDLGTEIGNWQMGCEHFGSHPEVKDEPLDEMSMD
jgi:hypothetical protein